jgi:hypothetical protein
MKASRVDTSGRWRVPLFLFLGVYFFSGLSHIATSFDSRWTVYIAMSIWSHGDTNLDEYPAAIEQNNFYALECVDALGHVRTGPPEGCTGHWYDSYPIGGTVLTTPLIVAAIGVMKLLHPLVRHLQAAQPVAGITGPAQRSSEVIAGFLNGDYQIAHSLIEMEVASFLLAAAAVMVYFIARRFLPVKRAVLLALLFALATSAYSVAGRAVWQHTPSMLLLTIIIYMLLRAGDRDNPRPSLAGWAGLPVALAYTVRPTDALFVAVFTLYVAVRHRRYLGYYLLAAAPVAAAFIAYDFSVYHALFSPYYRSDLIGFYPQNWPKMAMALAGNLISPSRGLLIFTPVFLFAIVSMVRMKWRAPLAPWLAVLALAHWIVVSSYITNWWAGHSYGPRFFTDITPIFALFLIPWFEQWNGLSRFARVTFVTFALVGFAIHLRGGWSQAVIQWNVDPVNIDAHPERNWDWSDPPFLRWRVVPVDSLPKDVNHE